MPPLQQLLLVTMVLLFCTLFVAHSETEADEMQHLIAASWNATADANTTLLCIGTQTIDDRKAADLVNKVRKFSATHAARFDATYALSKAALQIPGDFVETGLYTGGTAALMIGVLMTFDGCNRTFHGFDSFEGFPTPSAEDAQGVSNHGAKGQFIAPRTEFENNLASVGINVTASKRVRIYQGFFNDTCPTAPVDAISFLRLDGDLFASTWDALVTMYPKVSPGGLIYVDDMGSFNGCRHAINKYRTLHRIYEPLHFVREERGPRQRKMVFEAVWWRKRSLRDG